MNTRIERDALRGNTILCDEHSDFRVRCGKKQVLSVNRKTGEMTNTSISSLSARSDSLDARVTKESKSLDARITKESESLDVRITKESDGLKQQLASLQKELQALRQDLDDKNHSLTAGKQDQLPVGSVLQTLLSEKQFLASGASGWALCDGNQKRIRGTKWEALGLGPLPDARGAFLRMEGGQAASVGSLQGSATSAKDLRARVSDPNFRASGRTHTGSAHIYLKISKGPNLGAWTWDYDKWPFRGGNRAPENVGAGVQDGIVDMGHAHGVDVSGSINPSVEVSGASETRPYNMTVNYFVKVN